MSSKKQLQEVVDHMFMASGSAIDNCYRISKNLVKERHKLTKFLVDSNLIQRIGETPVDCVIRLLKKSLKQKSKIK